jgi:squalene cyclase
MYGLGKQQTKFGKWCNSNGVKQGELPINKNTATRLCSDNDYEPYEETIVRVISYLRGKGYDVRIRDFW